MARIVHINAFNKKISAFAIGEYVFCKCQLLGSGTYGTVYKAYDVRKKKYFAIKVIKIDSHEGVPGTCLREISILKALTHPNIVKILNVIPNIESRKIYMVFEHVDYDLKKLMEIIRPKCLPMPYVKSFLWQILRALALCHTSRVIHRDLKPQNILVARNGIIKIADFGLARSFNIPSRCYTHEVVKFIFYFVIVTLWYRAPEILLHAKFYSTAVDIWSAACIFAELITFEPLFHADSEISQLFQIFKILGTPNEQIWPGFTECAHYTSNFPKWKNCLLEDYLTRLDNDGLDLLAQMLLYAPEKRITAKAALSHRFLRDVPIHLEPVTSLFEEND
ncbi:unnamed protein product [Thelazia callipaeda]|uniref:cyclin-dependent kinase n=1 Tax=Thelazia callipaeda TaxID=103827 RepID=A0A0N5D439_THECL|nr:unnamed protein product [Thelazia callipaeda]